ncbi:MAG: PHP domain-containing protein [Planctomycetales bacterium]|nr:PHP domain-containing protein [Planctomycetales bacterium]
MTFLDQQQPRRLVDMHVHTRHSDGQPTVSEVEDFCLSKAIGAVITDHNEIRGSMDLCERGKVSTMAGIEVGTQEGFEFLTYFPDPGALEEFYVRSVEPHLLNRFMVRSRVRSLPALETARSLGAWISLAHPFAFGRKSLTFQSRKRGEDFCEQVMEYVDAVEVFNGGIPAGANRKAQPLRETAKQLTSGSDSHVLSTYGTSGVWFPVEATQPHELHEHLREAEDLSLETGTHCSVTRTVFMIVVNHSRFFLRGRKRLRLPREAGDARDRRFATDS